MLLMYPSLKEQAITALRERRHEDAQAILVNVVVSTPGDDEAWVLLAEAIGDIAKKRECLERAKQINPRNPAIKSALEQLEQAPAAGGPLPPSMQKVPAEASTVPVETPHAAPQSAPAANPIAPVLEHSGIVAQMVLLTTEAPETRRVGQELVSVLTEAAARDPVATRRWARSAGRGALIKYEKALTSFIANLPRDDPQLPLLREQRQLILQHLR